MEILPTNPTLTPFLAQQVKRIRVARTVWKNSGISRVELASALGLDKTTISTIVGEFLELGILEERDMGQAGPTGGRRPVSLALSRSLGLVAGIEIQPDVARVVLVDLEGAELARHSAVRNRDMAGTIDEMVKVAQALSAARGSRLLGLGFGFSGVVDSAEGTLVSSIPLGVDEPLAVVASVKERFGLQCTVENDARCCAWNVAAFGDERHAQDLVYALIERRDCAEDCPPVGLGFSFVLGGRILRGRSSSAGEFRSVLWNGGNASQFSIPDAELARLDSDASVKARLVDEIAIHIALFADSLDLSAVYLGGGSRLADGDLADAVRSAMRANRPYRRVEDVAVVLDGSDVAVARGAASAFLENLMGMPGSPDPGFDLLSVFPGD